MAIEVVVPPLGQTVDTVVLTSWYKQDGDSVSQGEPLFAVETDKAVLDVESPGTGILRQVTADSGDEVQVLRVIAHIAQPEEAMEEQPQPQKESGATATAPVLPLERTAEVVESHAKRQRVFISPRARRLAEQEDVHWKELQGTGPEGAIVERDIRNYLTQRLAATEVAPVPARTSVTGPAALMVEADATALVDLRSLLSEDGLEASYTDLLVYILSRILQEYPVMNAPVVEDGIKEQQVHIGIAVESDRGLLTPVVRDVGRKGLQQIAEETKVLLDRAERGQCTEDELHGSTFILVDLGRYGIDAFTSIIDPQDCAALSVGRIKSHPLTANEAAVTYKTVWLSLTLDPRMVEKAPAARFMQRLTQLLEKPHLLLA